MVSLPGSLLVQECFGVFEVPQCRLVYIRPFQKLGSSSSFHFDIHRSSSWISDKLLPFDGDRRDFPASESFRLEGLGEDY